MALDFKNKKILVIGLGRSGAAAARFAIERGANVTVSEKQGASAVQKYIEELKGLPINYSFGDNDPKLMKQADLIIMSPGVPHNIAGLSDARRSGVPVIGELELAVREITTPIIAVTGTNGKTTTTALIGHILSSCGFKVCVGGNIGTALTNLIGEAEKANWAVVEVSSYQLETTPSLSPRIGVLLNLTPDHLDRHASFEEYAAIKARLFEMLGTDGFGIYNMADTVVTSAVRKSRAHLIPFDATGKMKKDGSGRFAPRDSSRVAGGWCEDDKLVVHLPLHSREEYALGKVALRGTHNCENMLAAVIAASLCGGDRKRIQKGLETFRGLAHRIELVGEYNSIRFYDDSKGTNVGATVAALENFMGPVILIAGGLDKGGSYAPLAEPIRRQVKQLILIGEAKEKMRRELGSLTNTVIAKSMEDAVRLAHGASAPGDVVLLSPACASFDMFRDYAERGEVFARAVKNICRKGTETRREAINKMTPQRHRDAEN